MKDSAELKGVSLRTAWAHAAADPDHPPLIKLSARVTVIEAAAFTVYLNKKRLQASERRVQGQQVDK